MPKLYPKNACLLFRVPRYKLSVLCVPLLWHPLCNLHKSSSSGLVKMNHFTSNAQTPPPPILGKFMVGLDHRLQCKMHNCTRHKFPSDGGPGIPILKV